MKLITLPDSSPLVTLRVVFHAGAAQEAKPGIAWMTGLMLAQGGTRDRTYKEILDAMFPMAGSVSSSVDKEMIAFSAETHLDNLDRFYEMFRAMLLEPGWRDEDFERLRDEAVNYLAVGLRGQNDEELGKEVLQQQIYRNHCYGQHNAGTVESLEALTIDDLRDFYRRFLTREVVTVGLAGGYPDGLARRMAEDFGQLHSGSGTIPTPPDTVISAGRHVHIVQKTARSVAISFGHPIGVIRGHADYVPLLVATSALGQHRMSSGRLFTRMRQLRGLNYGDYAYLEYFPGGMFSLEPAPNLARSHQVFQIWIRPVERDQALFALRLALYEVERWVRDGLTEEEFLRTRSFLSKYVNLLLKTKSAELGYAIDSQFYDIPQYPEYIRPILARLTLKQVNEAIGRHIQTRNLQIAMVAEDAEGLKQALLSETASSITYNARKPEEILAEDKVVEQWPLRIAAVDVRPVATIF